MSASQLNHGLDYGLYAVVIAALLWLFISFLFYVGEKMQEVQGSQAGSVSHQELAMAETIALLRQQNQELQQQILQLTEQVAELQTHRQTVKSGHQALKLTHAMVQISSEPDTLKSQVIELYQAGSMSNRAIARQLGVDRNRVNVIVREHKQSINSEASSDAV
jgi:TolA-binding protein